MIPIPVPFCSVDIPNVLKLVVKSSLWRGKCYFWELNFVYRMEINNHNFNNIWLIYLFGG